MENNRIYLDIQNAIIIAEESEKKQCPFILGNTIELDMQSLEDDYLVPVFSRDNNQTISHSEFINTVSDAAQTFFQGEQFNQPVVRVSHEMKLRTRKGTGKLVENLQDDDSGSYYQRMMFMIEIPSINYNVNGCNLNLQICAVRSYFKTMLYYKFQNYEEFKSIFGIQFHVQGFKHTGYAKVVLNEGKDLFEVSLLSGNGECVKFLDEVYLDMLVNAIDEAVEKTEDYEKRITELFEGGVCV